jgi:hypothetical protein
MLGNEQGAGANAPTPLAKASSAATLETRQEGDASLLPYRLFGIAAFALSYTPGRRSLPAFGRLLTKRQ